MESMQIDLINSQILSFDLQLHISILNHLLYLKEGNLAIMENNKLYIAVGKKVEERELILKWALEISRGETICVLHVHVPTPMISLPIQEEKVNAFEECGREGVVNMLDDCLRICALKQVSSEKICIEKESVTDGIVELISQLRIQKLVMGAGTDSKYSRRMTKPSSKKANYVLQHAPEFCHIWFLDKDRLICTREGVKQPNGDVKRTPVKALEHDESDSGNFGIESSFRLGLSEFGGDEGSSDVFDRSSRASFSQSSICSPEAESAFSSPHLSYAREEVRESGLQLLALPQTKNGCQELSHTTVLEEYDMIDKLYDQLEQSLTEAEDSKREAFEESVKRQKAEKEALVATRKVRAVQRLFIEGLRQREEIHKEPDKRNNELEYTKSLLGKVMQELHEALDQKLLLENHLEKTSLSEKEMEEKLLSAVDLLQKFKIHRDELQVERDHALQEAEDLRKQLAQEQSRPHVPIMSEISFSDIDKATNYFDPSLIIGEGGKGNTYKGLLHHTEVAIKMLISNIIHIPQEFVKEVDVLSTLQHPNLITLLGACPEAWTLVYEYLPGGSLEERLNCKDNTPPLSWQTRIHIAKQLCSVLIFLHSRQPSSFVHGCLRPASILLDDNFVCKLHDFGVCCMISNGGISVEQASTFMTTELRDYFTYMDPEFLATGELTPKSDIYSLGIILLRLLTGRRTFGIAKEVESALGKNDLYVILDRSAGNWPFVVAEQLARMALRCCDMNPMNRPDLKLDIWRSLEAVKASTLTLSRLLQDTEDRIPHYFICPVFQEIMEDPHIAADGFTYEAEAIRGWLESDHDTSPMTNVKLENHDLIPNRALRSAIQEWQQHRHKSF